MPFLFYYVPYWWLMLPGLLLSLYATFKVRIAFAKYSRVGSIKGYTGAKAARVILDSNELRDVNIEMTHGELTDHYDPRDRTLRLSPEVYSGNSLASLGVAAHEAGHALQHGRGYLPLKLRTAIIPVASFGSNGGIFLFFIGFMITYFASSRTGGTIPFLAIRLMDLGIIFFAASTLFYLITLPVEINASRRAIQTLRNEAIIFENEKEDAWRVLRAAALTYVAAALTAVLMLLRLILLRNSRN